MFCGRLSEVGTKYRKNISPHKIFQHFPTTMDTGHRSEYLALPYKYLNICSTQTKDNPHVTHPTHYSRPHLCAGWCWCEVAAVRAKVSSLQFDWFYFRFYNGLYLLDPHWQNSANYWVPLPPVSLMFWLRKFSGVPPPTYLALDGFMDIILHCITVCH